MAEYLPVPVDLPPPAGPVDLLVVAGEHSGDEHAAQLVAGLKAGAPSLRVACLGGPCLQAAGARLLYDLTAVSIVGFVEVLRHYRYFKGLFDRVIQWIERYRPAHICLVDYPGFNLRLAKALRDRGLSRKGGGTIGMSYYIGPQVWAWKAQRRFQMAETLDRLGVIFPFEETSYADTPLDAQFVGHPFVRRGYELPFRYASTAPVLLLPGSRAGAVGRIFPRLLDGFGHACRAVEGLRAEAVYPSEGVRAVLERCLEVRPNLRERVSLVPKSPTQRPAAAVLMSSGTMSLAVAMSGIPGAIAYRLNPLSYWLGRALIDIPYIGISNLLLQRPLHPEFIQGAARGATLGQALVQALEDPETVKATTEGAVALREMLQPESGRDAVAWLRRGMANG